ncbi:MAG: UDP-3-O-(3-hydroxymyristoyl)glucosamine N-acyltransferase [Elusimicrobia bacterium]|nr:UDP-3-O-(3-hydroxymyristoyl)glucosamine N-acyltransferase [Elusimicrobiota bacterium]
MKIDLSELARLTGGDLEGSGDAAIEGAAGLSDATPRDVSFLGNPKYASQVKASRACCVFLPRSARTAAARNQEGPANRIYVDDPQWAFAQVLALLEKEMKKTGPAVVDTKSSVHYEAKLGSQVGVGPYSVIERKAEIGAGTQIGAQCYIGADARVGAGCLIYPQVVIRENCVVGDRAIVHSGTVIGSDGFGFSTDKATGLHRKIPQIGNVVVEDDVEIGSNVSIDRGTVGSTRIGTGTKIDNLVQIAHNVTIGKNCFVVSQTGIAGSTRVGNHVILAGQAGVIGHLTIGDGAIITAQSGIMSDVEPKAILFGSPARPHREAMKLQALMGKLPEIYEAIREIKSKLGLGRGPRSREQREHEDAKQ